MADSKASLSPRILTALVGMPIVAFIVYSGGLLFFAVVMMLALLGVREIAAALRQSSSVFGRVIEPLALSAVAATIAAAQWTPAAPWMWSGAGALVAAPLLLALWRYGSTRATSLSDVAITWAAVAYCGLFAFLILLRVRGQEWFWLLLLGVWSSDIGAYFAGRALGKSRLTPLSPGKTREGLMAGWLLAMVVCTAVGGQTSLGVVKGLILGLIIGLCAPLGDLIESFWKREIGVKDLGTLLPGHGGVLDRCDSLIFSAWAVYLSSLWMR